MGKVRIYMYPDYGDAIFWDMEGCCIGDWEDIEIDEAIIRINVDGLKGWYCDWVVQSLYRHEWTDEQWKDWWRTGLALAKQVKKLLPDNVDLYYFSINDKVWSVRPEDTDDGGIMSCGIPIKI